jgi:hypothetical protein
MTVLAFLLAAVAVLVVGITLLLLFLLGAHWLSIQIAKQLERIIESGDVVELDGGLHGRFFFRPTHNRYYVDDS